tara:strand:+ start:6240 stop:7139 length:900 start_codon:yes stop_codon:yes gene_type:complete
MSEIKSNASGIIQPFIFDNMPVRGMVLRINNLSEHVPCLSAETNFINKALAEMLAASAVLTHDLKNKANVTLQIQSQGPVPLLVSQCDKNGSLRAYAKINDDADTQKLNYKNLIEENAIFAVSVEQGEGKTKNIYQSLVGLNKTSVSSSVEQYFNDSVQLNTYFKVTIGEQDGKLSCGCIFLQALPEKEPNLDDWRRIAIILTTMKEEEILPGSISEQELLGRLFAEDKVRVYAPHDLHFASAQTRERMVKALLSLGEDQCKDLLKEGPIVMMCEFSGTEESFTHEDIRNIFDTDQDDE